MILLSPLVMLVIVAVSEEQHAAFLERFKAARVRAGLSPLISDESTLRMFAAVMSSAARRRLVDGTLGKRAGSAPAGDNCGE